MRPGVLPLLREPRWAAGLVLACAVAAVCVLLGQWQWDRRADRMERAAPLARNYDAAPRPLAEVLPGAAALPRAAEWTPVSVSGEYDAAHLLLARNRPLDKAYGYEVLVPLRTADGRALLVDRGWIPAGQDGRAPDSVPAPPAGQVRVTVRLRPWEAARATTAPPGQVQSVSREAVGQAVPYPLAGAYGVLAAEEPPAARAPVPLPRPQRDEGPHLGYTVQWYGFAVTALVVWVVAGRRELQARGVGPGAAGAGTTGPGAAGRAAAGPGAAGTAGARVRGARRAGRDEAAEDAEVDAHSAEGGR